MYLLDTHTLIWWLDAPEKLEAKAAQVIASQEVSISPVSMWEIAIKTKLGKLDFNDEDYAVLSAERFTFLSITMEEGYLAGSLPLYHKDPFDRMLVAQAATRNLTLITRDVALAQYGIAILKA